MQVLVAIIIIIIGNIISICVNSRINYYFVLLRWHMSFKLCEIDCLLAKTIIRAVYTFIKISRRVCF